MCSPRRDRPPGDFLRRRLQFAAVVGIWDIKKAQPPGGSAAAPAAPGGSANAAAPAARRARAQGRRRPPGPAQPRRPQRSREKKNDFTGAGRAQEPPEFHGGRARAKDRRICQAAPCRRGDGVSRPPEIERRKQNVSRSLIKHLHGSNRSNYCVFTAPCWVCNWLGTR